MNSCDCSAEITFTIEGIDHKRTKRNINKDINGTSLLHCVCLGGNSLAVKTVIGLGANINQETTKIGEAGMTPLAMTAQYGNVQIAEQLVKCGALINYRSSINGQTALMIAAFCGKLRMVRFLLNVGANAKITDDSGGNALIIAAQNGCLKCLELLLPHSNINTEKYDGGTALILAIKYQHVHIVEKLLENDISCEHLHAAVNYSIITKNLAFLAILIEDNRFLINHRYSDRTTPLMCAIHRGDISIITQILSKRPDVNVQNDEGESPLMGTVALDMVTVTKRLLQMGANPNLQNHQGHTVLMLAAQRKSVILVNILLGAGADKTILDKKGKTASDYAENNKIRKLVQ